MTSQLSIPGARQANIQARKLDYPSFATGMDDKESNTRIDESWANLTPYWLNFGKVNVGSSKATKVPILQLRVCITFSSLRLRWGIENNRCTFQSNPSKQKHDGFTAFNIRRSSSKHTDQETGNTSSRNDICNKELATQMHGNGSLSHAIRVKCR